MNTFLQDLELSLSPLELITLASLLSGEMLVGIPDPFPGRLTEEIEEAMQSARQTLAQRGHLSLQSDGKVVMDVGTAALVGTLVSPQAFILFTETTPGSTARRWNCYYRSPFTVLLKQEGDTLHLRLLDKLSDVQEQIVSLWKIKSQKPVRAEAFSLPESVLPLAQEARTKGEESVQRVFQEAGAEKVAAIALARTLSTPNRNGSLVVMCARENAWDVGGLGMLEGENGLWLLRSINRQNANWVEFVPCSARKLTSEIETQLKRFLPSMENRPKWKM